MKVLKGTILVNAHNKKVGPVLVELVNMRSRLTELGVTRIAETVGPYEVVLDFEISSEDGRRTIKAIVDKINEIPEVSGVNYYTKLREW